MSEIKKKRVKKPKLNADFDKWLREEQERTGKSAEKIIEETFKDGFLVWTAEDTEAIAGKGPTEKETISQERLDSLLNEVRGNKKWNETTKQEAIENIIAKYRVTESAIAGGYTAQAPPLLTAWAMPNVAEDIDEIRRLRREFAPVSRAVDYIKSMILGNALDVEINDPANLQERETRKDIKEFIRNVYQDAYTQSLYTVASIMLDEALTIGAAGAEIRYETSIEFMKYVDQVEKATFPVAKSSTQGGGREFVLYKSREPDWKDLKGIVQLKVFKNGMNRLKLYRDPETWEANYWTLDEIVASGETAQSLPTLRKGDEKTTKFHPWQLFWLSVNRREFDEKGMSVVAGVKNIAILLERIFNAVGEGVYRAGNKKYFIVCGTEKRPWSKPHIRNVMQQIQEMGKRNWTTVPVPYGFDIKEIGGNVFQANQIIIVLLNLIAQGMHVPIEVLGYMIRPQGAGAGERVLTASFNEIEQMRYEFKTAIENQLFRHHLWAKYGEKTRMKQGGKAVEPIYVPDLKMSTKGMLSPFDKLKEIINLLNVANPVSPQMKLELEREMADIMGYDNIDFESQEDLKKELKARTGTDTSIANPLMGKQQGQPEPQTKERQLNRLQGGVNKGQSKPMGGTRIPRENGGVQETEIQEAETSAGRLVQEPSQGPERISPSADYQSRSSVKTGGNYSAQGYYMVMEIPEATEEGDTFTIPSPIVDEEITVEIRKLKEFIAGYNNDLSKIYVDPEVKIEDYKPILAREVFEFGVEKILNLSYEESEGMADVYEKYICEKLDIDWDEHQKRCQEAYAKAGKRKGVKNPADIVSFKKAKKPTKEITYKKTGEKDIKEVASEGRSSMRSETGGKEAKVGGAPAGRHDVQYTAETEAKPQPQQVDVNIKVSSEPQEVKVITETKPQELKITTESKPQEIKITTESKPQEVVIVETSKPEVEKAIVDLTKKQEETTEKLTDVSLQIAARQDALKILEEEKAKETKEAKEKRLTAEMIRINMEIVNLEAERQRIEAEKKSVEETAQKKKELLDQIQKKISGAQ